MVEATASQKSESSMADEHVTGEKQECIHRGRHVAGQDSECHGPLNTICEDHFEERLNQTARSFEEIGRKNERARVVAYLAKRASAEFLAKREDVARLLRDLADNVRDGAANTD